MSETPTVEPDSKEPPIRLLLNLCGILVACAVFLMVVAFFGEQASKRAEADTLATLELVSETLNVEVLNHEGDYLDVRDSSGETFRCEYSDDFDGELYGCESTTILE